MQKKIVFMCFFYDYIYQVIFNKNLNFLWVITYVIYVLHKTNIILKVYYKSQKLCELLKIFICFSNNVYRLFYFKFIW